MTGKAVVTVAHLAAGPLSSLVDLAGALAEGVTDIVMDGVTDRYGKAHQEWEHAYEEKKAAWRRLVTDRATGAAGVLALPRTDLVKVSIVPFMGHVNWHFRDDQGQVGAYTVTLKVPARRALETAQGYFSGRMQREIAWFTGQLADQDVTEAERRARLTLNMRALLPQYAALPPCAGWLDRSLPGWRDAIG